MIWLAFVMTFVLVVVAIIVFAMDVVPFQREDLRVGVLSPHVTERIAMGKRNRTLAIALVTFVTAGCGPYVGEEQFVTLGYLVGVFGIIVLAWAAHYHRIVQLARDPDSVISASPHRVVVDHKWHTPGRMRVTPSEIARVLGGELPKSTVVSE